MENLKTSGIREMNAIEMKDHHGGIVPLLIGIGYVSGLIVAATLITFGTHHVTGGKKIPSEPI